MDDGQEPEEIEQGSAQAQGGKTAQGLAPDAAERQGRVTRLAIEALGASAAILFLNSEHDGLSDRPLPLATASEDGLQSVLRLLEPTVA